MLLFIRKYKYFVISIFIFVMFIICTRNPMNNLPVGDFVQDLTSPNGEYTLKAYRYAGKMNFDAWSVRIEVVNNKSQDKKNIYYKYKQYEIKLEWKDNTTVIINDKKINIFEDYYYENWKFF